jgi:hypothetical protein
VPARTTRIVARRQRLTAVGAVAAVFQRAEFARRTKHARRGPATELKISAALLILAQRFDHRHARYPTGRQERCRDRTNETNEKCARNDPRNNPNESRVTSVRIRWRGHRDAKRGNPTRCQHPQQRAGTAADQPKERDFRDDEPEDSPAAVTQRLECAELTDPLKHGHVHAIDHAQYDGYQDDDQQYRELALVKRSGLLVEVGQFVPRFYFIRAASVSFSIAAISFVRSVSLSETTIAFGDFTSSSSFAAGSGMRTARAS